MQSLASELACGGKVQLYWVELSSGTESGGAGTWR
jgi:hypothetical protein